MSKSSGSKGRGRNRNNSGKRSQNRGGNFDPNSGRNRGNAQQLMDKYLALARDAASQGDRVAAENYYQHADHYYRVVYARNEQNEARRRAAGNGSGDSAPDPIPVQPVDDGQGPVGLVAAGADGNVDPMHVKTNGGGQSKEADSETSNNEESDSGDQAPARKPRRGRPARKAKGGDAESPAPEAAE